MAFLWFGRKKVEESDKVSEANEDVIDYWQNSGSTAWFDSLRSQGWDYPSHMGTRDLFEWDRQQINRKAYLLYTWNPLVRGILDGLIAMIVGSGMTISHSNPRVDLEIKNWIKRDDIWTKLRLFMARYLVHGEVFPDLYINTLSGDMNTREIDPDDIKAIKFNEGDYQSPIEIHRQYTPLKWDDTNKDYVAQTTIDEEVKRNIKTKKYQIRDFLYWRSPIFSNSLRGLSVLTPVMDILTHIAKLNMIVLATAEARLSRREVWTVPPSQVSRVRAKIDSEGAPTPAEVLVLPEGSKVDYPSTNLSSGEYTTYLSQLMRFVCAALGVPESFGTADISAGTFSGTTAKYNEFERHIDSKQNLWHGFVMQLVNRMLLAKVEARVLSPMEIQQGELIINFPNFPRGYGEALPALQLGLDRGGITLETAMERMPFFVDPKAEQKKGAWGYATQGMMPQPVQPAGGSDKPVKDTVTHKSEKSPYVPHLPNPDFEAMTARELVSRLPAPLQNEILDRVM